MSSQLLVLRVEERPTFRGILRESEPVVGTSDRDRWHVAAGLNGKAVARTADGQDPVGTFRVNVSSKPPAVKVDPKTGDVVSAGDGASS